MNPDFEAKELHNFLNDKLFPWHIVQKNYFLCSYLKILISKLSIQHLMS